MFGIGDGTIEIKLDKTSFKKGETIKGILILDLKRDVNAMWLRADVMGEYNSVSWSRSSSEGLHKHRQNSVIYWLKNKIDESKEFSAGRKEYPFSIRIPKDISEWKINTYGSLQGAVDSAMKGKEYPIKWSIVGRLDKAWKFSTVGRAEITIS